MKIKLYLILILHIFICLQILAKEPKVDSTEFKIRNLIEKQVQLETKMNQVLEENETMHQQIINLNSTYPNLIDTAFDGISAELGASSNYITIVGSIIGLIAIFIGIYVTKIEKSVIKVKDENELLVVQNLEIRRELQELSEQIINDTRSIYKIIRNEETNFILERLVMIPEEIENVFYTLTSRDIEESCFPKLKEAFVQIEDKDSEASFDYLQLFYQHFVGYSIKDEIIKPILVNSLQDIFDSCFKAEMIKSVEILILTISSNPLRESVNEINFFVKALSKCIYANEEAIYSVINNSLNNRIKRFAIYALIEKNAETVTFRKNFGKYLLEYQEPNEFEREIINEINELI